MLKYFFLFTTLVHCIMDAKPICLQYDVDSMKLPKQLKKLQKDNLTIFKVKDPVNHKLGTVKMGKLYDKGGCDYHSRDVVIDMSQKYKIVKITTHRINGKSSVSHYIERTPGVYERHFKSSFDLDLGTDDIHENVHKFYDDNHKLHTIKVKDSIQDLKIGRIFLNNQVVEDLPNSLERKVYFWNNHEGKRTVKIDTHLNDNRIVSKTLVEDFPGSRKYVEAKKFSNNNIPLSYRDNYLGLDRNLF